MIGGNPLILFLASLFLSQAQNLQLGEWQQIQYTVTTAISPRYRHAGAFLSATNEYLVISGWDGNNNLNDFLSVNMSSLKSTLIAASTPLSGRSGMAYTSDLVSNFYIHGGWDGGSGSLNDFWRFNAQTRSWTQLAKGPPGRRNHCLNWDQGSNRLILFGGSTSIGSYNDLLTYSIESDQWQPVTIVGTSIPDARYYHACAFNSQSSTFHVQGGIGSKYYQDLWQFDFTSSSWKLINSGDSNVQRYGHSIRYYKSLNSLFMFFGYNEFTASYTNSIYLYSFNTSSAGWTLYQLGGSRMPSTRSQFSDGFNPQTGDYFVFGGYNRNFLNDFWKILIEDANVTISYTSPSSTSIPSNAQSPDISLPLSSAASLLITSEPDRPSFINSKAQTAQSTLLESSYSSQTWTQPESAIGSLTSFFRSNLLYLIVVQLVIVVSLISLCVWCRKRSRTRRAHTVESKTAGVRSSSSTAQESTTNTSHFTTTSTIVATELGLSIPGYLEIDFAKSIRIKSILAQGGFGTIALADPLSLKLKQYGDQVIVKQLKQSIISDKVIPGFYQEISLMEYFKGEKYIAKLLGYSTDPFCLVMKYYPLGSLSRVIRTTKNRSKIHVLAFSRDIAYGLRAMHSKGVVHHDVKSDNVLIDKSPETGQLLCVLSDLGISQILTQQILKVGEFKVTEIRALSMAYAAPERIHSFRNNFDLSSFDKETLFSWDVYALGIVMFEILTGKTKLYN